MVLGLTVVRADGSIVKAGGRVVKNVAGYDMVRLFTGSWGTLGIIAEAHLRLHSLPPADDTRIFVGGRPEQLAGFAHQLGKNGSLAPVAAEIVSPAIADALDMRTGHWRMAVRWLGHERAVEEAIEMAEKAAGRSGVLVDKGAGTWKSMHNMESQVGSMLTVRIDVPRGATSEVTQRASVFTGSDYPLVQASPLLGRVWIFVPASLYDTAKGERLWALRVEELRRVAAECGGGVRVESAPFELRRQVNPWGDPGDGQRFNEALKNAFDPGDNLMPGFFVGEL
jgi:glycolate oxidase FAD binding subunit